MQRLRELLKDHENDVCGLRVIVQELSNLQMLQNAARVGYLVKAMSESPSLPTESQQKLPG